MSSIAILGASGHGKVVADIAELCGFGSVFVFDDNQAGSLERWPILGNTEALLRTVSEYDAVIVAIGNNMIRERKMRLLAEVKANVRSLAHPSAVISPYASLGPGSLVCAGAVVAPFASIGSGAIINTGATVDHDCQLGVCVHISPGAHLAGAVQVGDRSWIGIGATVIQQIKVGCDVIIGAGSAVIRNVPDAVTVVGVPATILS